MSVPRRRSPLRAWLGIGEIVRVPPSGAEMGKAVDSRVRALGPDLAFLRFHLTLGDLCLDAAGHAELVAALRGIAADRARVLSPTHPDTLQSWDMLARHCPEPERSGLREGVVHGWEQVLAERERSLGPDDPTISPGMDLVPPRDGRAQPADDAGWRFANGCQDVFGEVPGSSRKASPAASIAVRRWRRA
jgi:hypothetical protein